jgi:hypothetical protein
LGVVLTSKRVRLRREEDTDGLDNEGVNIMYWKHLLEYELPMLRDVFLKEMKNVAPGWIEELEKAVLN